MICAEEAAVSIKSYSPDLIVFPFLSSSCSESVDLELVRSVIKRANVIIIGPGLSRNNHIQHTAVKIILESQSMKKQLIIDGVSLCK